MSLDRELSVNLGLPAAPLSNTPELFSEMLRVYNALRILANALDDYTGVISPPNSEWSQLGIQVRSHGMNRVYLPAFENIAYGETVAFYNDAGTVKLRKAVVSTYPCRGYCSVSGGVTAGQTCEAVLFGVSATFTAGTFTVGATYYQAATAGAITNGVTAQKVGYAMTTSLLFFNPDL